MCEEINLLILFHYFLFSKNYLHYFNDTDVIQREEHNNLLLLYVRY